MQDKDQLEQFISNNKGQFDLAEPNDRVWGAIAEDLEPETKKETIQVLWYWKAAVVVLLAAVTFLMVDRFTNKKVVSDEPLAEEVSQVDTFKDMEVFYTSIIDKKRQRLNEELEGQEALNYLEADIAELDKLYQEMREFFLESQSSPEVMDRLMHLLRQRLHLINSQLDILEENKLPEEIKNNSVELSM
jgi:HPt (histidine-containing phosphotransfer) domain-containing protein